MDDEGITSADAWDRYLREVDITYKLAKGRYFQSPGLALQIAAAFRRRRGR